MKIVRYQTSTDCTAFGCLHAPASGRSDRAAAPIGGEPVFICASALPSVLILFGIE